MPDNGSAQFVLRAAGGPILGASVPQEISSSGNCYIEVRLDDDAFVATAAAGAGATEEGR